jgi:hypothetical protein
MNAKDVIDRLRAILVKLPGGGPRSLSLDREIAALLFQLSKCDIPRAGSGRIPRLKTQLGIVFSPRKHQNVQGGLSQARCNVESSLQHIEWTLGWKDMKMPKAKKRSFDRS